MRATQVNDLSCLAKCPLEVLLLPGSPVTNINPLSYLPINEINIVGLEIEDLTPLSTMPLGKLSVSPDKLTDLQFEFLEELSVMSLMGPGDPEGQTAEEFFEKYKRVKSGD